MLLQPDVSPHPHCLLLSLSPLLSYVLLIFQLSTCLQSVCQLYCRQNHLLKKIGEKTLVDTSLLSRPVILKGCSAITCELVRNSNSQAPPQT